MISNFNINNYVWVQLTPYGRDLLRRKHEDLCKKTGRIFNEYPYVPPREDSDGWSKWQMWDLMMKFGPDIWHGSDLPFKTNIRVEIREPESTQNDPKNRPN